MSETQMLIHCLACNNVWDIDHDPDSCICNTDADWNLVVVDDEGYEQRYPQWLESPND